MLSRPTTEQILLDCCRELMTNVLPPDPHPSKPPSPP
jgi:hypothetical protein